MSAQGIATAGVIALAVAVAGVAGVLGKYMFDAYTAQVELRVAQQVKADVAELRIEQQARIVEMQRAHDAALRQAQADADARAAEFRAEIASLEAHYQEIADVSPQRAGDSADGLVRRIMCRIAGGADADQRAACDQPDAVTEAAGGGVATVTYTADWAARLQTACDEWSTRGQPGFWTASEWRSRWPGLTPADACDWQITGFGQQRLFELIGWLDDVDRYQAALRRVAQGDRDLLARVRAEMEQNNAAVAERLAQ